MADHNEMIETLSDVVQRLESLDIKYMVTGSFAMSSYVTARTTIDIDVILEISSSDARRMENRFLPDYYVNAASITRAFENRSMFNMVSNSTGVKVDCIIRKPDPFESEKFQRRRQANIGGVEFWVIGKEDLILSKLHWAKDSYSELQFRDIRNLLESGVDEAFLSDFIKKIGLEDVWAAFEQWKIQIAK